MNDIVFSNLDKLLLQVVFQSQQVSHSKEHARQQIQIYTADIVRKKSEICCLQEEISKSDEVTVNLHKRNSSSKENCKVWKPTYMLLNKHEEYLQKELQTCQEITEKDKKMYQDYMNQYEETFKQHHAKYSETAVGQELVKLKKEYEEIENRVLKQSELLKQKEAEMMDLQESASLRQNTKETLKNAAGLRQQSLELNKTAEELEKKKDCFKQQLERITEDKNHPQVVEVENANYPEGRKEFDKSSLKENNQLHLLNEKPQKYKQLHLPSIYQKLVQSVPTLKPLFQHTETGVKEREDPTGHSAVTSVYFSHVENETQKCNDTAGTDKAKAVQVSSIASLKNETPFRLLTYQKQTNSEQRFAAEATEIADKEVDCKRRKEGNKSKDSANVSRNGQTECYIKPTGHNSADGEDAEHFLRVPEHNIFPKTPDFSEVKAPSELKLQSESEGSVTKSPGFSFVTRFTIKSPGFNFFDSSAFGVENSPAQSSEGYSAGNLNPVSPYKEIGDLFGKVDTEDSFAFAFPSCSSGQVFQDGKDDFSFPFAFGSSQPPSLKGFQSSPQSQKPFSLF